MNIDYNNSISMTTFYQRRSDSNFSGSVEKQIQLHEFNSMLGNYSNLNKNKPKQCLEFPTTTKQDNKRICVAVAVLMIENKKDFIRSLC